MFIFHRFFHGFSAMHYFVVNISMASPPSRMRKGRPWRGRWPYIYIYISLIARKTIMKLFIPSHCLEFGMDSSYLTRIWFFTACKHQVLTPQCRVAKPATSPPWKSQDWEGATERVYLNALSPGDWLNKKGIYRYPPKTSPRGRDNLWESIGIPDMIQHEMGSGSSIGPPGGERWQMAPTAILWCDMVRMVWYGAIHSGDSQQNFNYLSQRWTLVEVSDQRSGQEKKGGLGVVPNWRFRCIRVFFRFRWGCRWNFLD